MPKLSSDTLRKAVVVVASCTISFLLYGTVRLSGLLFPACRERYNVGRKEASLPFALAFTMRNMSGPFTGYLGNKFGLRCVTLLGGLISAFAIGACFFVEDIILITVLWGGVFGVGYGIGSILIVNILHLYFETNFNVMHGTFIASGCLGSFVLPGIVENVLKTYGTSGTFLILAGVVLHCVPAAMLLKNPEKSQKLKSHAEVNELDNTIRISKEVNTTSIGDISKLDCTYRDTITASPNITYSVDARNNEIVKFADMPNDLNIQKSDRVDICYASPNATDDPNLSEKKVSKKDKDHPVTSTEIHRNKEQKRSIIKKNMESSQSIPDSTKHVDGKDNTNSIGPQSQTISRNLRVFIDPVYILILISLSMAIVVLVAQYIIIAEACRDKGITEDVTFLMTFAISEMLGRVAFGYVADADCMSSLNVYALCCGASGLLLFGFTWLKDFHTLLVFVAAIGALMGGFVSVPPGMIRDYIEKEHLTMAFSSRHFLFGFLNLGQPSVIGYFRETLHSYDGLYYLLGSMCLLSALISLLIPSVVTLRDKRRNKTKDTEENFACNISQK